MNVQMDSAGRIVLPKHLRDKMGLTAGARLKIVERDEGLSLLPDTSRGKLLKRNGRWVYVGEAPRDIN